MMAEYQQWTGGSEELTQVLCYYGSLYGAHIVLLAMLSAITVYRREMSCNHCYAEQGEEEEEEEKREGVENERDVGNHREAVATNHFFTSLPHLMKSPCRRSESEEEAAVDELLELAGLYCSGAALTPVWEGILELVSTEYHRPRLAWSYDSEEEAKGQKCCRTLKKRQRRRSLPTVMNCSSFPEFDRAVDSSHACENFREASSFCPFSRGLPADALIHILTFLLPKDIVSFACASKSCRRTVDGGDCSASSHDHNQSQSQVDQIQQSETSRALWMRDYAWTVHAWDIGQQALYRSGGWDESALIFDKDFYFRFGLGFINYVLAGQNTMQCCLVGLHGNIYDLGLFLLSHPGSPETVMVQAGKDATAFFESVGHSRGARRLAQSLCVLVDCARTQQPVTGTVTDQEHQKCNQPASCGLAPTRYTQQCSKREEETVSSLCSQLPAFVEIPSIEHAPVCMPRSSMSSACVGGGTLQNIRSAFFQEENTFRQIANRRFAAQSAFGDCNIFYDPFCRQWKAWYSDSETFQPVFIHNLSA